MCTQVYNQETKEALRNEHRSTQPLALGLSPRPACCTASGPRGILAGEAWDALRPDTGCLPGGGPLGETPQEAQPVTGGCRVRAEQGSPSSPALSPPWGGGLPEPWWDPRRPLQVGGQGAAGNALSGPSSLSLNPQASLENQGLGRSL